MAIPQEIVAQEFVQGGDKKKESPSIEIINWTPWFQRNFSLCLLPWGLERSIVYSQHAGPTSGIRHALGRDCYLPLLHGLDSFNAICRC